MVGNQVVRPLPLNYNQYSHGYQPHNIEPVHIRPTNGTSGKVSPGLHNSVYSNNVEATAKVQDCYKSQMPNSSQHMHLPVRSSPPLETLPPKKRKSPFSNDPDTDLGVYNKVTSTGLSSLKDMTSWDDTQSQNNTNHCRLQRTGSESLQGQGQTDIALQHQPIKRRKLSTESYENITNETGYKFAYSNDVTSHIYMGYQNNVSDVTTHNYSSGLNSGHYQGYSGGYHNPYYPCYSTNETMPHGVIS